MDGAVLTLDAGMRSEQARKGRYRFEAVRAGSHVLDLLLESLPEGASVIGTRTLNIALTKAQPSTTVDFLVKIDKRPEIRKVFPPKSGAPAPGSRPTGGPAAAKSTPTKRAIPPVKPLPAAVSTRQASGGLVPPKLRSSEGGFMIQIAALSQLSRARALAAELTKAGVPASVLMPQADDPDGLYRVRVGPYATRAAANRVLLKLEKLRGEKLWLIRAR